MILMQEDLWKYVEAVEGGLQLSVIQMLGSISKYETKLYKNHHQQHTLICK